jgi:hypothetical protein
MTVMTTERPTAVAPAPIAATVRQGVGALSLSAMTPAEVWGFCERLADTPLLPDAYRRNPASILWALEYGRALNLDVVTTINTIHVIKGKPCQSADLMLSRARTAGHRVRIQQGDGSCTASIWRYDDPEFENRVTWTYDDAVTGGLCEMRSGRPYARSQKGEPTSWEKWPRSMLRARAISECVRQACPEVLHGAIYTPEELGAVIDQDGNPLDVQPQLQRQAPGQDAWEQAAPAPAAPAQQPQAAAEPWDAAAEGDLSGGRDWINEATEAADVAAVRAVWQEAKAAGCMPERLAQIAAVGREKAAAEQQEAEDDAEEAPLNRDGYPILTGPLPDAAPDALAPRAQAEERLRIAASHANLATLDADFQRVYGKPIESANAQQLDAFRARIEAAGGAQ